ncbi:PHD finger and BAH domain protein [Tuber indicum]|nr:PHD finger and BAH domain protein [Tuber indicum]
MADRKPSVSTSRTTAGNGAAGDTSTGTANTQTTTAINTRSTSPYGTRSRGRGARINYAEDKDNDMDYEFTSTPSTSSSKSAAAVEPIPSTNASRRASAVGTGAKDKEAVKENTATAVATTFTSGKKRKSAHPPPIMPKDITLSNMMSFQNPHLKDGNLIADDGTSLAVNDHIYLVCEPPGEPYYLARIMEFLHANNNSSLPIDSIRVNWYYRPKDIQRKVTDTRVLFASMHSDCCPLASIRGKCFISHRSEVKDVDQYRKQRDSFYFEKMFDRYIHRYYDVIPTTMVRNVPEKVRKVLVERWKYLLVEPQRAKELCSQMKECKRCSGYCATTDSVHCAVCGHTYHMNCVRPPLLKKPSRGFAWACGPCNQAQERKLEARNTPNLTPGIGNSNDLEDDALDDEEEDLSPRAVPSDTATPSETADHDKQPTPEQLAWARMWPMRYLGQHCRVEDALDYDDRIYPRAASRIGPRHQANVNPWHGRPVEYVKPIEKKKPQKGGGKSAKNAAAAAAEAEAVAERERRPKWVMDEPAGYIRRGEDDGSTSTLLFKMPDLPEEDEEEGEAGKKRVENEESVDRFMSNASEIAETLPGGGVKKWTVNFQDKAIELFYASDFDEKRALVQLGKMHVTRDLKEPRFRPDEHKRFEEGVAKFGSELHAVTKNVKTRKTAEIVRYYYTWKKTAKGREIWGGFEGRKGKKEVKVRGKEHGTKLVDDVADDDDDSAFDNTKAGEKKRGFECKFCNTRESRQWRRAPGVQPGTLILADKGTASSKRKGGEERWLVSALCRRCAELWRRYGIQWEDPDEIQKKISQGGGRAWKRRIDEEMLKEMTAAQADEKAEAAALAATTAFATPTPPVLNGTPIDTQDEKKEPTRKRQKIEANGSSKKGKERAERKEPPPPPSEPPKPKLLPCGICEELEPLGDQHLVCRDCKMSVHKACYGVGEQRGANKWVCEMCANDKNPTVSTNYECVLCPCHGFTDHEDGGVGSSDKDLASKGSAKKKIPGEKDKPIINNHGSHEDGRKVKEIDKRRPKHPREPLKKTSGNNWAHVVCAVWTPETKFAEAKTMKIVEGIGTIPVARWLQTCKICESTGGACVECHACHESVHVGCAHKAGWRMGFDIQPVKGSRRDQMNIIKLGTETGSMTAAIWCPEHELKTTLHTLNEISEETGQNALQLYTTTYKQADLTLTGTVRKANLMTISTKASQSNRRNSAGGASTNSMANGAEDKVGGIEGLLDDHVGGDEPKRCFGCQTDVSPLWRKVPMDAPRPAENTTHLTNGTPPDTNGILANGDASSRSRTVGLLCHRCQNKDQTPEQSQHSPSFAATNGDQRNRYAPLPPLSTFLASQQAAPPPPPPPPAPHPVLIQGAGPSGVPQPMPLQIAPQLVPQMAPIPQHHPHPQQPQALPPHPHQQGHAPPPNHMPPHPPHISPHPPPSHVVPHPQQQPHPLPHHPPSHMPPHPPHVSPTRQHVVGVQHISPHQHPIHPMSPHQHQILPMSPHAPHLRSHQPPPPHPVSHSPHPPPPHQQPGMQAQSPQGPPQPTHTQPLPPQPQQLHPPPTPQPQSRPLASASESPALANLLS